jgi:hypothetical protein
MAVSAGLAAIIGAPILWPALVSFVGSYYPNWVHLRMQMDATDQAEKIKVKNIRLRKYPGQESFAGNIDPTWIAAPFVKKRKAEWLAFWAV